MPSVVITVCQRLGVHQEALKMILDPVKYGLFPMKKAMQALIHACALKEDVEGMSYSCQHSM